MLNSEEIWRFLIFEESKRNYRQKSIYFYFFNKNVVLKASFLFFLNKRQSQKALVFREVYYTFPGTVEGVGKPWENPFYLFYL